MVSDPESKLKEVRKEIKRRIDTGEYKTVFETVDNKTGKIIQRSFRRHKPPLRWISFATIFLLIIIFDFAISALFKEYIQSRIELIPMELIVSVLSFGGLIIFDSYLKFVYKTSGEIVIESIQSAVDLKNLAGWLESVSNIKIHVIVGVGYGMFVGLPIMLIAGSISREPLGVGPIFLFVCMSMPAGIVLWHIALFLAFFVRISKYEFKLHVANPSDSEVIKYISAIANRLIFIMATLMAAFTLILGSFRGLIISFLGILFLLLSWGPIILLFIFSQVSLLKIITKSKIKKLNEIQKIIDIYAGEGKLTTDGVFSESNKLDEIDYVNKLLALYDRIKKSQNTALNFRAGINLINSMLLPLLAFVLGNMEKIREFFTTTPAR
jgi:hypothetical protein